MDIVKGLGWFYVSFLLLMQMIGASSLLCYFCQDLPDSEQCFNVVKCTASEVCYGKTEKLASGNITHTTGCRDLQLQPMQEQGRVTVCNEHCQEDFCNLRSCVSNATLMRLPPRCPSCDYVHQPEDCKRITQCKQNEQCFVHKFNAFGLTRYRMGCVSQEHCAETAHGNGNAGPAIIGKRSTKRRFSSDNCLVCCSKDHCNANACYNQSTALEVSALKPLSNGHICNDSSTCKTFGLLNEDACRQRQVVELCPASCETCGFFGWQSWQAWSSCDTSCGTGTKTRQRQCQSQISVGSVTHCAGDSRQTAACSSGQCAVDGKWSAWGAWQTCSVTCGGGSQHRTRVCQYDPAMPRGSACVGAVKQNQLCGQSACPTSDDGCCPDSWLPYKGSCYLFHDEEKMNWYEARQYCNNKAKVANGDIVTLVAIETRTESLFLKYFARKLYNTGSYHRNSTAFWLGASDSANEGIWKWVDKDEELTFTDWDSSLMQPNKDPGNHQDCLSLNGAYDFNWHDGLCRERVGYPLCEKRRSSTGSGPMQIIG